MAASYPGDLLQHLASFSVLLRHAQAGRAGAFDQAARELHVDRSVLRRRMQVLTGWVGVPLLSGRGPRMSPTAAGLRLVERSERIHALTSSLRTEVAEGRERLVIGCTGTVATELVPGLLLALERGKHPVELAVRRSSGAACEAAVRSGELDLGVVRGEAPADLKSTRLLTDRLYFVVPAAHPLARGGRPSLSRMASLPLVLYGEASRTRARVMARLAPLGARIRVEIDGRAAALGYVRAGIGATFLSLLPGHLPAREGVVFWDVTSSFAPSPFWLIAKKERWDDPVIAKVRAQLAHAVKNRAR